MVHFFIKYIHIFLNFVLHNIVFKSPCCSRDIRSFGQPDISGRACVPATDTAAVTDGLREVTASFLFARYWTTLPGPLSGYWARLAALQNRETAVLWMFNLSTVKWKRRSRNDSLITAILFVAVCLCNCITKANLVAMLWVWCSPCVEQCYSPMCLKAKIIQIHFYFNQC